MAELTIETVRAIAALARLRVEEGRLERWRGELARIVDYFSALEKLDLDGVEPTAHVLELAGGGRPDQERPCLARERALEDAPDADLEYFRVPRVIG